MKKTEKQTPKWKKFEKSTHQLLTIFNDNQAVITYDDKITGIDSKTLRQIDTTLRGKVNIFDILVAVSCKDYSHKVDINDVSEFATTLKDIRANKGIIIASSQFTQGAINLAKNQGIETYSLIDTTNPNMKGYAKLPALLHRTYLQSYSFRLSNFSSVPRTMMDNVNYMSAKFTDTEGKREFVRNIVAEGWEKAEKKLGQLEIGLGKGNISIGDDNEVEADLTVILNIAETYYFGYLPIETTGLLNAQDGGYTTKSIETDKIIPFEIEQGKVAGWKEIKNPSDISIQPVFILNYSDCIPKMDEIS